MRLTGPRFLQSVKWHSKTGNHGSAQNHPADTQEPSVSGNHHHLWRDRATVFDFFPPELSQIYSKTSINQVIRYKIKWDFILIAKTFLPDYPINQKIFQTEKELNEWSQHILDWWTCLFKKWTPCLGVISLFSRVYCQNASSMVRAFSLLGQTTCFFP